MLFTSPCSANNTSMAKAICPPHFWRDCAVCGMPIATPAPAAHKFTGCKSKLSFLRRAVEPCGNCVVSLPSSASLRGNNFAQRTQRAQSLFFICVHPFHPVNPRPVYFFVLRKHCALKNLCIWGFFLCRPFRAFDRLHHLYFHGLHPWLKYSRPFRVEPNFV